MGRLLHQQVHHLSEGHRAVQGSEGVQRRRQETLRAARRLEGQVRSNFEDIHSNIQRFSRSEGVVNRNKPDADELFRERGKETELLY